MDRIFHQLGETEQFGSQATLNTLQARLRESHSSGLVEVQVNAARRVILVFANGTQVGAYLREGREARPFRLEELPVLWGGAPLSLRAAALPDKAARTFWLMLESRWQDQREVMGRAACEESLRFWEREKFEGLVEAVSGEGEGFFVFRGGRLAASESIFHDGTKFDSSLAERLARGEHWTLTTYKPNPASKAWQALHLRQGALGWGSGILARFQSIAGQKFLQAVEREIRILIQPWKWLILLENACISDDHFFAGTEAAAQAYRTLFMSLGMQMNFIIGGNLTQRILTERFNELDPAGRAALETSRLVPAAFSS